MIRRDADNDWLLISQVEHARIAAELAEAWQDPELTAFPGRRELFTAIRHHDDGWAAWELAPTINEAGEPRDFTEMTMAVATSIWTRSVEACASRSEVGGLWVSRHFCYLAERACDARDSTADRSAITAFLSKQSAQQSQWREMLAGTAGNAARTEERGYLWLQAFDRISLWLCCAERSERWELELPSGTKTALTPLPNAEIAVEPFSFGEPLRLSVPTLRLPRQALRDDEELMVGQLTRQAIEWRLTPTM